MAANEISDQRYAEIIQIVGRPSDRSPGNYNERLERETSRVNSLIPFLERASAIDPVSITHLSYALTADNVDDFDLVTDSEITYTVSAFPGALSLHPEPTKKPSAHSALVSLSIELEDHMTPRLEHSQPQSLPSLVLPIGQLQKGFKTARGIPQYIDTDYILVVDAAGTSHAFWLVYDRYQRFDEEFKDVTDPKRAPLVFVELGKNFDAAQVFPSIKDWIEAYGTMSAAQFQESIKKTGMVGEVKVRDATSEDLATLENK